MISNPEVKRTLATLRKAEFGFLGVIVEKLTDKSPLLPLYRTVHEIFTSYGSSFNSFEVIGSVSSFENLPPSSTLFRRVTRRILFTKHMWIQSRSYNKNKKSFSIFCPPFFENQKDPFQSSLNLFVWNLDSSTAFLFTYFFFLFFHHSLSPTGLIR